MTAKAHNRDEEKWRAALKRAALPDSAQVSFSLTQTAPNTVSYRLSCTHADGTAIGDDRDYDLLKVVITPLEHLCSCESPPFQAVLSMITGQLDFTETC